MMNTLIGSSAILDSGSMTYGNIPSPILYDILAIQHIYGTNTNYNSGDDVYALGEDAAVEQSGIPAASIRSTTRLSI